MSMNIRIIMRTTSAAAALLLAACGGGEETENAGDGQATIAAPDAPTLSYTDPALRAGSQVICAGSFDSTDSAGNEVTATLSLFNSKAPGSARAEATSTDGNVSLAYTLKTMAAADSAADADIRGDSVTCALSLSNGSQTIEAVTGPASTIQDSAPSIETADGQYSVTATATALGGSVDDVQLAATDADGDSITYTVGDNSCGSMIAVDSATGLVSATLPEAGTTSQDIACSAQFYASANGVQSGIAVTYQLSATNTAPTLSCTNAEQTLTAGASIDGLTCSGQDSDVGTVLTYSLEGCPGVTVDANTGAISGTMPVAGCAAPVAVTDGNATTEFPLALKRSFENIPHGVAAASALPSYVVRGLDVDGSTVYAATPRGLAVFTDDGATGSNWQVFLTTDGINSDSTYDVAASGTKIVVATERGLALSNDAGATWTKVTDLGDANVYPEATFNQVEMSGDTILASMSLWGPLIRSDDGGLTWTATGLDNVTDVHIDPSGTIYAATYSAYVADSGGVQISNDGGLTWSALGTSTDLQAQPVNAVYAANDTVYVGLNNNGIAYTIDGGANWTVADFSDDGLYAQDLVVDGSTLLVGTNQGVYSSTDGGVNWASEGFGSINELLIDGTTLWAATGSAAVSKAGLSDLTTTTDFPFVSPQPDGPLAVDATRLYAGAAYSVDEGASWNRWSSANRFTLSSWSIPNDIYVTDGGAIYIASPYGLYASIDGGSNWQEYDSSNGLPTDNISSVAMMGSRLFVGTSAGIAWSDDPANLWTEKGTSDGLGTGLTDVKDLASDGSNVYAATTVGLAISTDGGATWSNRTTADGLAGDGVYGLALFDGKVYAATDGGLSVSSDGGVTWTTLTSVDGLTVAVTADAIALGSSDGLYLSSDGGVSWVQYDESDGLSDRRITSVAISGDTIYAQAHAGGLARSN